MDFFNCPSKQANKMKLVNQKVTCTWNYVYEYNLGQAITKITRVDYMGTHFVYEFGLNTIVPYCNLI
jgi:hypothetical protein